MKTSDRGTNLVVHPVPGNNLWQPLSYFSSVNVSTSSHNRCCRLFVMEHSDSEQDVSLTIFIYFTLTLLWGQLVFVIRTYFIYKSIHAYLSAHNPGKQWSHSLHLWPLYSLQCFLDPLRDSVCIALMKLSGTTFCFTSVLNRSPLRMRPHVCA